jgi:hypothetical protein
MTPSGVLCPICGADSSSSNLYLSYDALELVLRAAGAGDDARTVAIGDAGRRDRLDCHAATIAAIEQAGATAALDHAGKRQALSDLAVRVLVYPSWPESPYR